MARAVVSLVLIHLVGLALSQPFPQLLSIEGIPTSTLFFPNQQDLNGQVANPNPPPVVVNSAFGVGRPLDSPLLPPVSQRTIYKVWNPHRVNPAGLPPQYTSQLFTNFQQGPANVFGLPGAAVGVPAVQRNEVILLRFAAPIPAVLGLPNLILQQPNLDVDPYAAPGCAAIDQQLGACRCGNLPGYTPVTIQCQPANSGTAAGADDDVTLYWCPVPTTTYFPFSPLPGENPYIRSYRRICLQYVPPPPPAAGAVVVGPTQFLDTQLWFSVQSGCIDDGAPNANAIDPTFLFRCAPIARDNKILGYATNQPLPAALGGPFVPPAFTLPQIAATGLSFLNSLGPFYENSGPNLANFGNQQIPNGFISNGEAFNGEALSQRAERLSRGTCCGFRVEAQNVILGVCINPAQGVGCCGTNPFDLHNEQCCSRTAATVRNPVLTPPPLVPATLFSIFDDRTVLPTVGLQEHFPMVPVIRHIGQPCPCNFANQQNIGGTIFHTDCASWGPNVLTVADNTGFAGSQPLNSRFQCCVSNYNPQDPNAALRYPEYPNYIAVAGVPNAIPIPKLGYCFDTQNVLTPWRCCDDGNIYNPNEQTCCAINGVQSITDGCPCEADADCVSPVHPLGARRCCKQRFPSPRLLPEDRARSCGRYANFPTPSTLQQDPQRVAPLPAGGVAGVLAPGFPFPPNSGGNSPTAIQRCTGRCIDPEWQICCNGIVCINEFESCCNDTCCNKHSQTCVDGYRPGSLASRFNTLNFMYEFEICSTIEAMNGRRAFNIFIVPIFLLFATVASLALLLTFTRRAVEHVFELTERAIVFIAAFSVLISTVYFFSPMYKFGIVIIWINLALIAIAAIRTIKPAILAVILQVILILYIIDPFPANHWFGLSHGATGENELANPNDLPSSLFETAYYWWRDRGVRCVRHYDYFNYDFNTRDTYRWQNPTVHTFGYCSREWISTLMIFAGFLVITELLLLLLVIFSLVKLLGFKPDEVVQLEVRAEPVY